MPDFIHLRVHSAYSLSEGAIKVKELIKLCQKQQMPAVAITDTGNLFGALEFAMAAADAGVQPIIGCQLAVARPGGSVTRNGGRPPADHLVLLVQSETGYRNLIWLVSRAFLESEPGAPAQLPLDMLSGRSEGLICLTGGPQGPVGRLLGEGQHGAALDCLERLKQLFPGRLYVELMRHDLEEETRIEDALIDLAYAHDLPLVATNDCFFADESVHEAHDALLCIADGAYVLEQERRRVTPDHRFKSAAEMRALFADLPEAVDNTIVIAQRCAFLLKPIKPMLPTYPADAGRTEAEEMRAQARAGLKERLAAHVYTAELDEAGREAAAKPYRERLEYELGVIEQMKFPGYFLIVADFIKWAKAQDIPVGPGRGSGAGSVVAWALTITDLDPLRFGLLFERFLNPDRISMPDFDIDFCQDRRDEVIAYVRQRYGEDRVAQIITFGKLQARAVLRDVGRVLQMPYGQVDRLCKLVPNNPAKPVTLQQAVDGEPLLQHMRDSEPNVARLIGIALKLEGLYRHASTHAAGIVIGDRPLDQLIPLYRDPRSDMLVTQFSMKYVEEAGLVKFDFLGLKTLTVLEQAVKLIEESGETIDLSSLPLGDRKSYEMLSHGDTTGVFQLESSGMRDTLKRLKPDRFEDIIALVALYRPGPMDNIPKYIKVKDGEEKPDYLHPSLEPILKETFGIMIYQEQVMQIAQVLSGFSLAQADNLRRAMGKKIQAEMDAQRQNFIEGAVGRQVDPGQAATIFDQVNKFAGYGFNKSHAAAYAIVAYQTAYLKANYPVAFMAASMTLDLGNTDKLAVFRQELDRLKIKLLPPDINRSGVAFKVEKGNAIRYALAAVKGVGEPAMRGVVAERDANGPYRDLFDFARRLDPRLINRRQLETLAWAGAFDSLNNNRAQVHGAAETMVRFAQSAAAERESGQNSLFGGQGPVLKAPPLPAIIDLEPMERLKHEFESIGFCLSAHPLDSFEQPLKRLGVIKLAEIQSRLNRGGPTRIRLAGVILSRQERTSARGNRFAFAQLSDTTGVFEICVFSELLAVSRDMLEAGNPIVVTVDVQFNADDMRLTAQQIEPLEKAVATAAAGFRVFVRDENPITHLRAALEREGKGRARINVVVGIDAGREIELSLPGGWAVTPRSRGALKAIPGVVDVHDL